LAVAAAAARGSYPAHIAKKISAPKPLTHNLLKSLEIL